MIRGKITVVFLCLLVTQHVASVAEMRPREGAAQRLLGGKTDFAWQQLPAGRLRERIQRLPAVAQRRAEHWLRGFTFPPEDLAHLHVDANGGIFYIDPAPLAAAETEFSGTANQTDATVAVAPFPEHLRFHSQPGSANILYLDFDGESVTGTAWNDSLGRDPVVAVAFSTDSDYTTFSADEQTVIRRIWQRVAEDYAPFDINVTTERPSSFDRHTAHALITRNTDADGLENPASDAGGIAYVNVFGKRNYGDYRPAWIYANNLASRESYIAEVVSHEIGHNLGLSHDGTTDGTAYYAGHGSGDTSWAPIMGVSFRRNVSQWSRGEYALANNPEDDVAMIAEKLQHRADDHGDTPASGSVLEITDGSNIVATTPLTDPDNTQPANKGLIEHETDVDVFSFDTGAGEILLAVRPWVSPAFTRGGNLDLKVSLWNESGEVIAETNAPSTTSASLVLTVAEGRYFLQVEGAGTGDPYSSTPSGYTSYASVGQYFITGRVVEATGLIDPPSWTLFATVNQATWGGVSPSDGTYPDGTEVQVTATPSNYFVFSRWDGGLSGSNAETNLLMDTNKMLHAVFSEIVTTNHGTPHWWLAHHGFTNDFERAAESLGANQMAVWQSYIAGLAPNDPQDVFAVTNVVSRTHAAVELSWPAVSGRVYSISGSTNLGTGFDVLPEATHLRWPTNRFELPLNDAPAFYRLGVSLDPSS